MEDITGGKKTTCWRRHIGWMIFCLRTCRVNIIFFYFFFTFDWASCNNIYHAWEDLTSNNGLFTRSFIVIILLFTRNIYIRYSFYSIINKHLDRFPIDTPYTVEMPSRRIVYRRSRITIIIFKKKKSARLSRLNQTWQ